MHAARLATEKAVSPARPAVVPHLPGLTGQPMSKPTYREQLLDPRWQRKRLERLSLSDFACEACGDKENTLHVHHRRYVKGRMAWEYTAEELQTLCKQCHADQHSQQEVFETLLQQAKTSRGMTQFDVMAFVAGLLYGSMDVDDSDDIENFRWNPYWDAGVTASLTFGDSRWIVRASAKAGSTNPAQLAELVRWDEHEAHYQNGTLSQLYGDRD